MTASTDIVVPDDNRQLAIKALLDLEAAGAIDEVSLQLTDPSMPYQRWEDIGRFFGSLDRRVRWYIGDWLNFGESVYGEDSAQAVEPTTSDRYDEAERVTGLDRGTLMNIRSVCAKVARERRRSELGFWIHSEVAKLEPDEQSFWLQQAIDNGWTKDELRAAIREAKNPSSGDAPDDDGDSEPGLSRLVRAEQILWLVVERSSNNSDGDYVVPSEVIAQARAFVGDE